MASNKRKQDEKHLKMLREMVALPSNKQCFDCHQRGPTYVNMTIGSFVCTSCSGILRGLNPPHRVKSISMASFTPEEMDFLKSHGNELNRKVYLGLYDSRSWPEPDSRDEQRVRDYMVQKYENRRWYVSATDAMRDEARRANEAALSTGKQQSKTPLRWQLGEHATPKPVAAPPATSGVTVPLPGAVKTPFAAAAPGAIPQPVSLAGKSHQPIPPLGGPSATTSSSSSSGFDLLGDLGGDPFASSSGGNTTNHTSDTGGFADFSNFNAMSSTDPTPVPAASAAPQMAQQAFPISSTPLQPLGIGQTPPAPLNQAPAPASTSASNGGDRYAALADLDSAFSAPATTATSINWGGMPDTGSGGGGVNWGASSTAA
ncbi:ARF-GAP domain and fg repeat-containing protein 1-like, partial [Plakobranchus ocellatus]